MLESLGLSGSVIVLLLSGYAILMLLYGEGGLAQLLQDVVRGRDSSVVWDASLWVLWHEDALFKGLLVAIAANLALAVHAVSGHGHPFIPAHGRYLVNSDCRRVCQLLLLLDGDGEPTPETWLRLRRAAQTHVVRRRLAAWQRQMGNDVSFGWAVRSPPLGDAWGLFQEVAGSSTRARRRQGMERLAGLLTARSLGGSAYPWVLAVGAILIFLFSIITVNALLTPLLSPS